MRCLLLLSLLLLPCALDDVGNRSADSANCAIADFVGPGAPEML